jgi:polyketide synthase 13
MLAVSDPPPHPYAITGTASSIIANRVSYFYDFRGPSMAIDTACSSSLVAIHEGVKALRARESDVVLAGGVNALITPMVTIGFDEVGGVLAPDGRIKSFSSDADGYARSEGGGMVVLKRWPTPAATATRSSPSSRAAVNHDGRSNGMLAPNPDAQAEVLRKAYQDAGIDPRTVDYIEAHGTGTILGDPIEADALGRVVGKGRPAEQPALLGAVKSNVGHLESAAGAASIAKMTLAIMNDKIPPSINYAGPNPYIDFDKEHLRVADEVTERPHTAATRSSESPGSASAVPTPTWWYAKCCPRIWLSPNRFRSSGCRAREPGGQRRLRGRSGWTEAKSPTTTVPTPTPAVTTEFYGWNPTTSPNSPA